MTVINAEDVGLNPYDGTGGTTNPNPQADSPYGADKPGLVHQAVDIATAWTGINVWDLAENQVSKVAEPVAKAVNNAQDKLEQIVPTAFKGINDTQDKANTMLEYVAIIAAIVAGCYVLSLAAPFLPRGKA